MKKNKLWLKKAFLLGCLLVPNMAYAQAVTTTVYGDDFATGWENWSWGSKLSTDTTHKYKSSGNSSLAVTYTEAWAAVSFRTATPINTTGYSMIRFAVYGAEGGGELSVSTQATDEGADSTAFKFTPTANAWTVIEVPLTALGSPTQIARISIQNGSNESQPTYSIDELYLIASPSPAIDLNVNATVGRKPISPSPAINLSVDATVGRKPISPLIYGINNDDKNDGTNDDVALMQKLGISVRRWGGNSVSRYNWQLDASNRADDWYFENFRMSNATNLPTDSAANRFIANNKLAAANSIITIPMIGYVAKDGNLSTCGFSIAKYGLQQSSDKCRPDCGNGVKRHKLDGNYVTDNAQADTSVAPDCDKAVKVKPDGSPVTDNDRADTSIAVDAVYAKNWVSYLVTRYGKAVNGGVNFYGLDNEPDIWFATHRDIAPQGLTYDQLRDRSYQYAAAIKQADPSAKTLGPSVMGWTYYWHSPSDGQQNDQQNDWRITPDRDAHDGIPLVPWYLQQMKAYELTHGKRLLDYLDLHYYPATPDVYNDTDTTEGDAATQAKRLESTRSLWDNTYVDQSWIGEIVKLIPRMRDWVDTNYPGTKLAITEYNWGAPEHINGALAQADVLGIFGREGLDLATLWVLEPLGINQPLAFAFRMYRNYDGSGGKFGDTSINAVSNSQGELAIYAAEESATGALTIMVINKTGRELTAPLTLNNFTPTGTVQRWRYDATQLGKIVPLADQVLTNNTISSTFSANSITLYRIPGHHL